MQNKRNYIGWIIVILTISIFSFSNSSTAKHKSFRGYSLQDTTTKDSTKSSTQTLDSLVNNINDTTLSGSIINDTIALQMPDSTSLSKLVELTIQGETELITQMYDSLMRTSNNKLLPLDSLNLDSLAFPPKIYTQRELKALAREKRLAYKDSLIRNMPRVLDTYILHDSTTRNQRMFLWKSDTYFNTQTVINPDTTYNSNYTEQPSEKEGGSINLGVAGSAMEYFNYFKREESEIFPFISPYLPYTYTAETMPFYNTKTPYTELAYWGTLFANKQKEESNIRLLHTQNMTPAFNFSFLYERYGGNGILVGEATDNRTTAFTGNYLGKRYIAQGGYIANKVVREENGGVQNISDIIDTTLDAREVPIVLSDANNTLKMRTFFINQTYSIPFKFLKKRNKDTTNATPLATPTSIANSKMDNLSKLDSLAIDSTSTYDVTTAFIGHYGEYTTYTKSYYDNISSTNTSGREYYNNNFFIDPNESSDSVSISQIENRLYLKVQPWAQEAIVSKVEAGIGYQLLSIYKFDPSFYVGGNKNIINNNIYTYFGASGQVKKYFAWSGFGKYNLIGYNANDFSVDGNMRVSVYPNEQGIHLKGKLHISNKRPNYFYDNYYSNHYIWNNNFEKTTKTKIEAELLIPDYKVELSAGYALLNNNIYFDTLAIARQNSNPMSIFTASLKKKFVIWNIHLDNQVLFQASSNQDVVPLPTLALNLRYYLQFDLVKNVMQIQLGANMRFNTKYYAPAYSAALGLFHNQNDAEIGGNPYIDAFVNIQWKRASIFVKYINAAQEWPTSDYLSAYGYIQPQTALKFGIFWPFHYN